MKKSITFVAHFNESPVNAQLTLKTMVTKRTYVAPECEAYMLPSGLLFQNPSIRIGSNDSEDKVGNSEDIGFSKSFGGSILEETDE